MDLEISILQSHLLKIYQLLSTLEVVDGTEKWYLLSLSRDDILASLSVLTVHYLKLEQIMKENKRLVDLFLEPSTSIPQSHLDMVPNVFLRTKWIPEIESAMEDAVCSASEGMYASSEAVFSDTIAAVSSCIRQYSKLVEEHDRYFSALVGTALEYLEEKERMEKEAELGRGTIVGSQIDSHASASVENLVRHQLF